MSKQKKLADPIKIPPVDTLLGPPVAGYEGKYWHALPDCQHEAGFLTNPNNIRIPKTIHVPTGATCSYIKILATLADGSQLPVWTKYHDWSETMPKEPLESLESNQTEKGGS